MNDETAPAATQNTPAPIAPRRSFSFRPILIGAGSALAVLALGVGGFALADTLDEAGDDRIVITSTPEAAPSIDPNPMPTTGTADECVVAMDNECVVSAGTEYDSIVKAALAAVGGETPDNGVGTVIEVEAGSPGDSAWKVEIRLPNGDEAEVHLDATYNVIRVELDNDHSGSDDGGSDDD